jgi:hypothetical protein
MQDLDERGSYMKPKPKNWQRWAAYGAFIGAAYTIFSRGGQWAEFGAHPMEPWEFAAIGEVIGGAIGGAVLFGGAAASINYFRKN